MKRYDWERYSVGEPSRKSDWVNVDCCPFTTVYHVAHVSDAFRIFEDRRIRSSLVWDESKLQNTRTCVAWLSPNLWADGSFYGNIKFAFDWRELIAGKRFYWVEDIRYSTPACRILITKKKPSLDLEPYPVEDGNGPLYYDSKSDVWYYNGKYTGEFMVDEDLRLADCKEVGFENHHPRICKKDDSGCRDLGQERYMAGAKLLSRLIAQKALSAKSDLSRLFLTERELHRDAERAWEQILRGFSRVNATGRITDGDSAASALASAMLDRFGAERSVEELGSLFSSSQALELTIRKRAAKALGISVDRIPQWDTE